MSPAPVLPHGRAERGTGPRAAEAQSATMRPSQKTFAESSSKFERKYFQEATVTPMFLSRDSVLFHLFLCFFTGGRGGWRELKGGFKAALASCTQ